MSVVFLPRRSLQPLIMVGTGAESVPAATTEQGLLTLFGARFVPGTGIDPANKFFSHESAFDFHWKITGYAFFMGQVRGAVSDMEAFLQVKDSIAGGVGGNGVLLGWSSAAHGANAYFEAARIIPLPCPIIVPKLGELYFWWIISNLGAAVANFDVQLHLQWTYADEREIF